MIEIRTSSKKLPQFMNSLLESPQTYFSKSDFKLFSIDNIREIRDLIINTMRNTPNYVQLGINFNDCLIIGDIHGDLKSTLQIIKPFLENKIDSLLFLGDYVDRGEASLNVFILIMSLMIAWPERVIALRGNHEDIEINFRYGFLNELKKLFPDEIELNKVINYINNIYDYLSISARTPNGSICAHGGIPNEIETMDQLNLMPKPHGMLIELKDKQLIPKLMNIAFQLMWNDPNENQKENFKASFRALNAFTFNGRATQEFLDKHNAKRFVRGHQSSRGGFEKLFDGQLLHIFSTQPYFGHVPEAFVIHETQEKSFLRDLEFNIIKEI